MKDLKMFTHHNYNYDDFTEEDARIKFIELNYFINELLIQNERLKENDKNMRLKLEEYKKETEFELTLLRRCRS